jgi:hypothetical protein
MRIVICLQIPQHSEEVEEILLSVIECTWSQWRSATEIHTAEPFVPDPTPLEFGIAVAKLKHYKSPSSDQIRQNLFKQEMKRYSLRSINSLILFGVRKNCLISGMSPLLFWFKRKAIKLTVVIMEGCHCYRFHTKFIQYPSLKNKSICRWNYWGSSMWVST